MIGETQTGFVEQRQIPDGLITANEEVRWLEKKKKKGALFKVDFRKTYDSVRWVFLEHMLKQFGL